MSSEIGGVRYSMVQQIITKNVFLPQSLGELNRAEKLNAFFVEKIETDLDLLPRYLSNGLKLNNAHTLDLHVIYNCFYRQYRTRVPSDVYQPGFYKIVLTNTPDYFLALIELFRQYTFKTRQNQTSKLIFIWNLIISRASIRVLLVASIQVKRRC